MKAERQSVEQMFFIFAWLFLNINASVWFFCFLEGRVEQSLVLCFFVLGRLSPSWGDTWEHTCARSSSRTLCVPELLFPLCSAG